MTLHPEKEISEVPDSDAYFQAQQYLAYVQRGGDPERWWASKGFSHQERSEIEREVARLRRGGQV